MPGQPDHHPALSYLARRVRQSGAPVSLAPWRIAAPPGRSPAFIIADGFGSQTRTTISPIRYEHLRAKLRPGIIRLHPGATVRAFSYSLPGLAYVPADTNIRIDTPTSNLLVEPYAPPVAGPCLTPDRELGVGLRVASNGITFARS